VHIFWNSVLTKAISSGRTGPEAYKVVSSAKRKSVNKEARGRSLIYSIAKIKYGLEQSPEAHPAWYALENCCVQKLKQIVVD
jgi:hypothetical protein